MALDSIALTLEELPGPVCVLEASAGKVIHHNASFAAWAGRADVAGLALGDLFPGDAALACIWEEARAEASIVERHLERRGRDGAASFWSVRARRTGAGVLVCASDLTAFAAAARAVHACQRDYVAAAAHELRAPLSAIKAWASALDARRHGGAVPRADEPLLDDGLAAIARQVDRMNELLSDLLEAARTEAGAVCAARSSVEIGALVRGAVAASPARARADVVAAPPAWACVDPVLVEAVLGGLLAHAGRRAPEGPIVITTERSGAEIHVLVTDAGPPLRAAVEQDLFGRGPGPGRGRGAGIGLHVLQLLAAVNGGRVWRERDEGGARFVVALPDAERGRPARGPVEPRPLRALVAQGLAGARLERAASVLRLFGHDVAVTSDGARLWRHLDEAAFDLVLVDLLLPGVGGLAALERISKRPDPPVILVTAPSGQRPAALDGAERAGALAVLSEPLDWAHLVALVQSAASARAGA